MYKTDIKLHYFAYISGGAHGGVRGGVGELLKWHKVAQKNRCPYSWVSEVAQGGVT